jgi:hypothetical protein
MQTIALFIDDAETARPVLLELLEDPRCDRILLVACPPALTYRIGRWLTNQNREQWRRRWSTELFAALQPLWAKTPKGKIETSRATGPLPTVFARLQRQTPATLRPLDARRARIGATNQTTQGAEPDPQRKDWAVPAAVASGISLALALTD